MPLGETDRGGYQELIKRQATVFEQMVLHWKRNDMTWNSFDDSLFHFTTAARVFFATPRRRTRSICCSPKSSRRRSREHGGPGGPPRTRRGGLEGLCGRELVLDYGVCNVLEGPGEPPRTSGRSPKIREPIGRSPYSTQTHLRVNFHPWKLRRVCS